MRYKKDKEDNWVKKKFMLVFDSGKTRKVIEGRNILGFIFGGFSSRFWLIN